MIQYPVQLIFQKRLYWSDLIWRTRFLSSTFFIFHSSEGLLDIRGNYQDVSISKNLLRCSETNSCIQFPSRRSDGYQYNNWHLDPATRVNTLKPDCLNPAPESTQASVESSQRWPVMDIMYRDTNSAITLNIRISICISPYSCEFSKYIQLTMMCLQSVSQITQIFITEVWTELWP